MTVKEMAILTCTGERAHHGNVSATIPASAESTCRTLSTVLVSHAQERLSPKWHLVQQIVKRQLGKMWHLLYGLKKNDGEEIGLHLQSRPKNISAREH